MRFLLVMAVLGSVVAAWAQETPSVALEAAGAAPPAELTDMDFLCQITQHLYRWYMDEADVEKKTEAKAETFIYWVRRLDVKLDEGDRSVIGELLHQIFAGSGRQTGIVVDRVGFLQFGAEIHVLKQGDRFVADPSGQRR